MINSVMPSNRARRAFGIAAAAALGAATLALGPAAQAASAPTLSITAVSHLSAAPAQIVATGATAHNRSSAIRPETTSCTITPSTPFQYSGEPYGEGVEGLAEVQCTGVVYALQVEAEIYNDNTTAYTLSGYDTEYNAIEYGNNAEYPLTGGYWQTCGAAYVWWTSSTYSYISACTPAGTTYIS